MKTLLVRTIDEWCRWLDKNHASESEIWLVFNKKQTGVASVAHKDALDEALCMGWIDSLVRRLNDRQYAIKFTPRRPDSRWSEVNRKRYTELEAAGRLKPAGIERRPGDRGSAPRPQRISLPSKLPAYIQGALNKNPKAKRHFDAMTPAHRRHYFAWIESAKREETKLRRLKEAIRLLAKGEVLGLK